MKRKWRVGEEEEGKSGRDQLVIRDAGWSKIQYFQFDKPHGESFLGKIGFLTFL